MLHTLMSNTCTSNKEGQQNPVDVVYAPQVSNHTTHTTGIQNPPVSMANQLQGLANCSTQMGTQNPNGTTQTNNSVHSTTLHKEDTTWACHHKGGHQITLPQATHGQQDMDMHHIHQILTTGKYQPGPFPSQKATSSQAPAQVQQVMGSPLRTNRACRQRSMTPLPNDDSSTKEMFVSTFCTMFSAEIGAASTVSGAVSSGKSAKILNGVNQHSLCAYMGCKTTEDIPESFFGSWTVIKTLQQRYRHWKIA